MGNALCRNQSTPGHAAGEARLLGAEAELAHPAVNTVGADQHVGFGRGTVSETRNDAFALVFDTDQPVARMRARGRYRIGQQRREITAMEMIVRRAECRLDLRTQRSALQGAAIIPAPLMHAGRPHAPRLHRLLDAEPVQQPRRIGADLNAGPDLAELRRLLVDLNIAAGLQQCERCGEPADSATDDRYA
jgi:hypothetical protein